jgi:CheY-like chemotaxis protein
LTYRVLVVDDYERWRIYIRSTLQKTAQWQIVGEATDGFNAIEKAQELNPDIILLDVGLPSLNGIQAARQILDRNPSARVLFVSEHRASDIAEAALNTGACGYVLKSDAARELLPAMQAAVEGRFVGARLAAPPAACVDEPRLRLRSCRHEVALYSSEAVLVEYYATFAEMALRAGNTVVVVTNEPRRHMFHERLEARGITRAARTERIISLGVSETLSQIIVDGLPDVARFMSAANELLAQSALPTRSGRLSACGDCAQTLWQQGNGIAALQLERLWDQFAKANSVDILCGYPFTPPHDAVFREICAEHSAVHSG